MNDTKTVPAIVKAPAPKGPAPKAPGTFGPTIKDEHGKGDNYPSEMRRQLWPLCCGASIISGFKTAYTLTDEQLLAEINHTIDNMVPDHQVFKTESMRPALTFLTLNSSQMQSPKIMGAIEKAGFVKFAEAKPRGLPQGFFVKDTSKSFQNVGG